MTDLWRLSNSDFFYGEHDSPKIKIEILQPSQVRDFFKFFRFILKKNAFYNSFTLLRLLSTRRGISFYDVRSKKSYAENAYGICFNNEIYL